MRRGQNPPLIRCRKDQAGSLGTEEKTSCPFCILLRYVQYKQHYAPVRMLQDTDWISPNPATQASLCHHALPDLSFTPDWKQYHLVY